MAVSVWKSQSGNFSNWVGIGGTVRRISLSVANNDWWLEESSVDLIAPYWAEVSLRVAERVLHDQLGLARPAWLNAAYYRKSVLGI